MTNGTNGNLTGDPLLGDKSDSANGGPTRIRTLLGGSPGIDAADSVACSAAPISDVDQRGVARDGNCDMGAYEFNNDAVIVNFSAAETSVDEDAGTVSLTVLLHKEGTNTITVDYDITAGTSTREGDFTDTSGRLTFAAGETSKTIDITILNDTLGEPTEYFLVNLDNATNAALGNPRQARVEIVDDDQPNVSLSAANYSVNENGGNVTLTIQLNRASESTMTVDYRTSNQTATDGSDYTAADGTLTFNPGETSKTIQIPISEDSDEETNETFVFELISPTNSGLGTVNEAIVMINDNDGANSGYTIFLPMITN
ncbi:MAG: Calx-beta domain-containing protein [Chloroflexota bacterium]